MVQDVATGAVPQTLKVALPDGADAIVVGLAATASGLVVLAHPAAGPVTELHVSLLDATGARRERRAALLRAVSGRPRTVARATL